MEGVVKRPLTGMISGGVAAPRAIDNAAPTVVHTIDNSSSALGGPFVQMVTLWVNNTTAGALDVTVIVAGGASIVVAVAAKSTVKILDEEVFQNAAGVAPVTITAQGSAANMRFWGDFAVVL